MEKRLEIPVWLPGTSLPVEETILEDIIRCPRRPEVEDVHPVEMRHWRLPVHSHVVDALIRSFPDDPKHWKVFMSGLLEDIWKPSAGEKEEARPRQSQQEFSWNSVVRAKDTRRAIGIDLAEIDAIRHRDEGAHRRVEELLVDKLVGSTPDLVKAANEAFAPRAEYLLKKNHRGLRRVDKDLLELLNYLRIQLKNFISQYGPLPPSESDMSKTRYRKIMKQRLERWVSNKRWPQVQVRRVLWRAGEKAKEIRSVGNDYLLESLKSFVDPPPREDEARLFRLAHVYYYALATGAVLSPIMWDPVLEDLPGIVSTTILDRLLYLHTQETTNYPPEWKEDTNRVLCAYLELYKLVTDEIRMAASERKKIRRRREISSAEIEKAAVEPHLPDYNLIKKEEKKEEDKKTDTFVPFLERVVEEVMSAGLLPVDAIQDLQTENDAELASDALSDAIIRRALEKNAKSRDHLYLYSRVRSLPGVADRMGCKRANVSKHLGQAVRRVLEQVWELPATRMLIEERLDGLGVGDRVERFKSSSRNSND